MKRILALLLILVLLAGCGQKPEVPTETTAPTTQPTLPQLVPEQDEPEEEAALLTYALQGTDHYAVTAMGDGVLLFSGDEYTTLTYMKEDSELIQASLGEVFIYPSPGYCTVTDRGIGYYDGNANELVFLDTDLTEQDRVSLPDGAICMPVLSEDWKYAYYFDENNLRRMELSTGISRILSDTWGGVPQVTGIHFGDTVLQCNVFQEDESLELLIDANSGQVIYQDREMWMLDTYEDWYFAEVYHTWGTEYVFGQRAGEQSAMLPQGDVAFTRVLPREAWAAMCEYLETGFSLALYDAETGTRKSEYVFDGVFYSGMAECLIGDRLWLLVDDMETGAQMLYAWDPELSLTEDVESYIGTYHTAQDPDTEGLDEIAEEARLLGEKYGVRILTYQDATDYMPVDFVLEAEHAVGAYGYYLSILEDALATYPEGFLKKLGKCSRNGRITVSLVKEARGDQEMGAVEQADGVQFWDNGNAFVALSMNYELGNTVHHELYHVIDTYVLTETLAYDFWDQLNPEGFAYFESYQEGRVKEDSPYLNGDTRAFVDEYAMSYAKEDRARIMEYAMLLGQEEVFASDAMQAKLRTVCAGIREAFGLEREPTIYPWEQYLRTPMI